MNAEERRLTTRRVSASIRVPLRPIVLIFLPAIFLLAADVRAATPLFARGYTAIPEPQRVSLRPGDFRFGPEWHLELSGTIHNGDIAPQTLREELADRFHLSLEPKGKRVLRLAIAPKSVQIGTALDRDAQALSDQAYRLDLSPDLISITANAPAGLFYGAVTFIQLLKRDSSGLWLPEARITDWPDLQLRQIYWDDAHHLDRMEEFKRALRTAAFFKINGFVLKLEGHFQFRSAPAIVEPWALTPAQLQELTDYALRYHIQLVPYLDGPGHIAFILKHPEYAPLRQRLDSNYELCSTNPDAYKLMFGMFDDLLAANRGGRYFYLSTDEPYYIGLFNSPQCQEETAARRLGGPGKLLAEFVHKTADYLHERGRTVVFWGEFPLKPEDIPALPSHIVNGEVAGRDFDRAFRAHGIRQMIYTSIEGEEKLFPNYFHVSPSERLHPARAAQGRVAEAFGKIANDPARADADVTGAVVAGWADMGLHTETFWLGYATAIAAAWNPGARDPRELMSAFYPLFFGPDVTGMDRVYRLLSAQAEFWSDSWETAPSKFRKPILGNSFGMFPAPVAAKDQTLPLPPIPAADNPKIASPWSKENGRRVELAASFQSANEELSGLLHENLLRAGRNRYTLEVFLTIAAICRQNLDLIQGIATVDAQIVAAGTAGNPKAAIAALDRAIDTVEQVRADRNEVLRKATEVWQRAWHPRVSEANGRRFLHELDDIKDHLPDRTVDMSYLVYREWNLPVQDWMERLIALRNSYASEHKLQVREVSFDWTSR